MLKGKVLIRFRGENYSTIYEIGKTYDFEDARARNLASRGLVEIVSEVIEKAIGQDAEVSTKVKKGQAEENAKVNEKADEKAEAKTETLSDVFPTEPERKPRGRQHKTEQ
ncbi:MAG: hypothetical protein KBT34_05450 [Prevotella sp.]|nr:hypothetical protein [Candidatus Prevotella equi]